MRDVAAQQPKYTLTIRDLEGLSHFAELNNEQWRIYKGTKSNFKKDAFDSSVKVYLPGKTNPLTSRDDDVQDLQVFESNHLEAVQNYNQSLCKLEGLHHLFLDIGQCTPLNKTLHLIDTDEHKLLVQSKSTTTKITLSKGAPESPEAFIFLPGSITYNRKYIKKSGDTKDKQGHYELSSIDFSNHVLRDLYLGKIKLTKESLEKKIDEALAEESEQAKYEYYKSVALNIHHFPRLESNFDASELSHYRVKHLQKILAFLMQTKMPVDDKFKNALRNLSNEIPNLDKILDKTTYKKLNLFLDPKNKLIFWPLNITFTPDSPELKNSSNSCIKMLKGDKDSYGGANEGNFILTGDPTAVRLGYPIYADACDLTFNGKKLSHVFSDEYFYKYLLEKSKIDLDLKKVLSENGVTGFNNFKKLYADRGTNSLVTHYFLIYEFGEEKAEKIKKYYQQALLNPTQGSIVANLDMSTIGIPGDATYKNRFTSNFFVVDDKVYFSTLQQDIITRTMDDNKTLITIHGTSRAVYKFNETNSELISFEFSNAEFRDLTLNSNLNLNKDTIKNYHKKETVIEEFKSNFEDFKKNLNTSFTKNIKNHYENFSKSFKVRDKKDELENDIRNHLMWIIATFQHKHPSEELATDLKKAHTKFINAFAEKLQSINGFAKPDIVNQVEDFFEIAFVKTAQVYTNQSILHIAQNGIDHIKEKMNAADIDKAYENIILAQTLKKNSEKFYKQTDPNAFTKENAKEFYVNNFIFPITRIEPKLDIHRNKWDLPLKNIGMFFITLGTWGLATIGKAIYAAIANIKYKYVDKIKKHVSYTLDSHTQSYKVAHEEAKETARLNKLVDKFVLKK